MYPKKWNPVLPGRCSPGDFTAPSISQSVGTSQPKQKGGGLQTIALLQAPLINCRSQSSGYHALSRIKIKIETHGRQDPYVTPMGYKGLNEYLSLNHVFKTNLNFSLEFTLKMCVFITYKIDIKLKFSLAFTIKN